MFPESADLVWRTIRGFDQYSWAAPSIEAAMEGGRAGDAVGGIRRIFTPGGLLRQRLVAHSDADRSYTSEFCDSNPYPARDYRATLRVTPVIDGNQAFVEWYATFDCDEGDRQRCIDKFEREGFAVWLASLREHLAR